MIDVAVARGPGAFGKRGAAMRNREIRGHVARAAAMALLGGWVALAQEKPADAPHDMEHGRHGSHDGGFMQRGMHHAVAQGVTLEQKMDAAAHTITLHV